MELDVTPSCVKGDIFKEAWLSLTKSNYAVYEVESTTWDSLEIEEGIFLEGGNHNRVGPMERELSCV